MANVKLTEVTAAESIATTNNIVAEIGGALKRVPVSALPSSDNVLYGKKIAYEGDSICYGNGYTGGYAKIIGDRNSMVVSNTAVSGGTLAVHADHHCICTSIASMPANYDYYIFEGGTNDVNYSTWGAKVNGYPSAGESDTIDNTTYLGGLEYACRALVTTFPAAKKGFVFVHRIFGEPNDFDSTYKPQCKAILEKYGIPYIDIAEYCPPLNSIDTLKSAYTLNGDGWHPNQAGYENFYADPIEAWLRTL